MLEINRMIHSFELVSRILILLTTLFYYPQITSPASHENQTSLSKHFGGIIPAQSVSGKDAPLKIKSESDDSLFLGKQFHFRLYSESLFFCFQAPHHLYCSHHFCKIQARAPPIA